MALKGKRQQKVQLELCSPKWKKIKVQDSNLSHVTKEMQYKKWVNTSDVNAW